MAVQITQAESLQDDPVLSAAVAGKSSLLELHVNGAAAEAIWELDRVDGRPGLTLRLRDQAGYRSSASFAPLELRNDTGLTSRLTSLGEAMRRVVEWRKTVDLLLDRLRPWCVSLPGEPAVCKNVSRVSEQQSGEYLVLGLIVARGNRLMTITPVAAWVVGWDGLVEMNGPGDRATLVYSRDTNEWYHIPNYLPYRQLPLTERLFRDLAVECLDD